jgi:hypothetical protein
LTGFLDLCQTFEDRLLHPLDLKMAVADHISEMLEPVRKYFEDHPENYEIAKKLDVTR